MSIFIPLKIVTYRNQSILGQVGTHAQIQDFKVGILSDVSINENMKK